VELEHFKLSNSHEVNLFSERLDNFLKNKIGQKCTYIDLNLAYEKLQGYSDGGRLFTALLDLKLNFAMLDIDSTMASGTWNQYFSKGKFEGGSVLENQLIFNGKTEIHYYHTNFIPRYRAIWDKIMGILILIFKPEKYDNYRRARSRKKEFEKLCKDIPQIPDVLLQNIFTGLSEFDNNFRTPEIHGTGSIRKWSFTTFAIQKTPLIDFGKYWNWLLLILSEIDRLIETLKVDKVE
jgi:hypothetical protein